MSPAKRSLVATAVLVACIVLLLARHALFARRPLGLAMQGMAVILMVWARWTFGVRSFHAAANPTAGGLVTSGPYHYWRHPIYAAILLFMWAGVLGQGTWPTLGVLLAAALGTLMTGARIQAEEQLLRSTFADYGAYAQRTKRLIPFVL